MTDRVTPIAADQPNLTNQPVTLAGRGKTWGLLFDEGRFLEVRRGDLCVTFDLWASARLGRAVVWSVDGDG